MKALEVGESGHLTTLAVASLSPALWLLGQSASEEGTCLWKGESDHVTGGAASPAEGSGDVGVGGHRKVMKCHVPGKAVSRPD